jgi:hypothetical protein
MVELGTIDGVTSSRPVNDLTGSDIIYTSSHATP